MQLFPWESHDLAAFDSKSRSIKPIIKWHLPKDNQQKRLNIDQAALLRKTSLQLQDDSNLFPLKCYCEFDCWEKGYGE